MHYPFSSHPYFKGRPYPFAPTRDKVSISFGEEVKASQVGKYQVNKREVVGLIRNKVKLLQTLEAAGVDVPTPIHASTEFISNGMLDVVKFDEIMAFPCQARRHDHTMLIESYRDLMVLLQRDGAPYVIHGMDYDNFTRGFVTLSPRLKGQYKVAGRTCTEGIIDVEAPTEQTAAAVAIANKVTQTVKFDVGTVELLFVGERVIVENVQLSPTEAMLPFIDAIVRKVIQR